MMQGAGAASSVLTHSAFRGFTFSLDMKKLTTLDPQGFTLRVTALVSRLNPRSDLTKDPLDC